MAVFCTVLQNFAECTTDSVKMRFYRKVGKPPQNSAFFRSLKGEIMSIRVLFVCHGNICRSTMAQFVFQHMVNTRGLAAQFHIDSAATSREEIGNGPHYGTVNKMRKVGIPVLPHHARQMTKKDYQEYDYLIGMDEWNIRNMNRITGGDPDGKIHMLLEFSEHPRAIADPWYTGNFDATYADVTEGCEALLELLTSGTVPSKS
jgi:protein-tyrosine-phosphatase|nr:MAG TPA: LMWPTP protein [Caudoviricetes sp.]